MNMLFPYADEACEEHVDRVTCPHCGQVIKEPVELFTGSIHSTTRFPCWSCHNMLTVMRSGAVLYSIILPSGPSQ